MSDQSGILNLKSENPSLKRVLICPLDWGLGHATRCIPIIKGFQERGCEIYIASSGQALQLLKNEFPELSFDELPAYNPYYSSVLPMTISMALQLPKFMKAIKKEHKVLKKIVEKRNIDLVISDNRYGCWSNQVKSIFITHQVNILVPWYLNRLVKKFNSKSIANFSLCWIPDWKGEKSLAGKLSQSSGNNFRYIGPLSRFKQVKKAEKQYELLAIISGPEPQRQVFENLIRKELLASGKKALLVKGIPSNSTIRKNDAIDEVDFLDATNLNKIIQSSEIIICRSGYSTIMDLIIVNKNAILVPTPGQTEQEYLAKRLSEKGIMCFENQNSFDMKRALLNYGKLKSLTELSIDTNALSQAIDEVV